MIAKGNKRNADEKSSGNREANNKNDSPLATARQFLSKTCRVMPSPPPGLRVSDKRARRQLTLIDADMKKM